MGLPFETVIVDPRNGEHLTPQFKKLNPHGKMPVLVDEGFTVFESVAICLYLADKYPEHGLMPTRAEERAQANQWLFFCVMEVEAHLQRIDCHAYHYPEASRIAGDIALAKQDFRRGALVFEDHMRSREFVLGDRFSVVDIVWGYVLVWSRWENLLADFENLNGYLDRLASRPAFPDALKSPPIGD